MKARWVLLVVCVAACGGETPAGGGDWDAQDSVQEGLGVPPVPPWTDPQTGLTWQNPHSEDHMRWSVAEQYCSDLEFAGHTDWRLPTILELRSLIRGCPGAAVTSDTCFVGEEGCLGLECLGNLLFVLCPSCGAGDGPADGCYWPDDLLGICTWSWSSVLVDPIDGDLEKFHYTWYVDFEEGSLGALYSEGSLYVRCVR